MDKIKELLEGKKTYLLALLYIILALATGKEAGSDAVLGLDPDSLKEAVAGLMVISAKAAWNRFANKG